MRNLFILFLSIAFFPISAADKIRGYVFDENKQPVIGANIYWEKSKSGTVSDTNGFFEIELPVQHQRLVISYTGYSSQIIHVEKPTDVLKIYLKEDLALQEVVISKRLAGTVNQRSALVQTQKITYGEICRAACCNLGESFQNNPSVDVAYSDATTGAKQIKMLGLAGTYVQMLTENYPNFRGVASPFGLDYVPANWMDGIYISKGTSSVRNGYEALAGQINVEYKKPQQMDKLSVSLFGSDSRRMEVSADGSFILNNRLSAALFASYANDTQAHDGNHDTFLDYPKVEQLNLMNRWNYQSGKYLAQYGVKYLHENREGGQDDSHQSVVSPYSIHLKTHRGEFFTKQAIVFDDDKLPESLAMIASASLHDQQAMYDTTPYDVNQANLYLNFIYEKSFSKAHNLSVGVSLNHDAFREKLRNKLLDREETVLGAYMQYTYNLNDKLIALGGVRADYSSQYGFFVTPRMHLKYEPTGWLHLRASLGKGFRTANVLAENNYLLASARKIDIAENLQQEIAWNAGINATIYIPFGDKQMTIIGEWYHTRFLQQVVVDVDSDPHAVSFYNLNEGTSYANNAQVELSYPFFDGFTFTAAYRYTRSISDYKSNERLSKPLLNDYKGLITASYQTPLRKWQFDLTGQFNGGGRMPTPDSTAPLWEKRFGSFTVVNGQITKFFRSLSIYVGVENLLDFTQANPIIDANNPRSANFDATMVWGPVHGRKIYGGIRYRIPRY